MGFTEAIRTCLRKYVTFSGRAARPEYWYFVLFLFLGNLIFGIFDAVLFEQMPQINEEQIILEFQPQETPLSSAFSLLLFLPSMAAAWRRMHDTGRSGLYVLYPLLVTLGIGLFVTFGMGLANMTPGALGQAFGTATALILIPAMMVMLISPLLVLWWLTRPSQPGTNDYGPHPNEVPS